MPIADQDILDYIATHPGAGREDIRKAVASDTSDTTMWRALKRLTDEGQLTVSGKARATGYTLAGSAQVRSYLQTPYNKRPTKQYNKEILDRYVPEKTFYLSAADRERLYAAGQRAGPALPAGTYPRRILEKLLVDLAWASSRMEGNTYDILQTEQLVKFGKEATGKDRKEAVMILNHKDAIQYLVDKIDKIRINQQDICNIHALLSDGLLIDPAMAGRLRRMPAGISYSSYKPPDDEFMIAEEFDITIEKAAAITDPFEQSFFLLVHIPYLQAFVDVNKRTSRVASNIPLLKAELAPMSFMTMDDRDYIDGLIGIYEMNNVSLLCEVYVDAYLTSAENYKNLRAEVESPEKAAIAYREFVKDAVRISVLDHKSFDHDAILAMAETRGVPEVDREQVVMYVSAQFNGLHEGNAIRYRLTPEDLTDIVRN